MGGTDERLIRQYVSGRLGDVFADANTLNRAYKEGKIKTREELDTQLRSLVKRVASRSDEIESTVVSAVGANWKAPKAGEKGIKKETAKNLARKRAHRQIVNVIKHLPRIVEEGEERAAGKLRKGKFGGAKETRMGFAVHTGTRKQKAKRGYVVHSKMRLAGGALAKDALSHLTGRAKKGRGGLKIKGKKVASSSYGNLGGLGWGETTKRGRGVRTTLKRGISQRRFTDISAEEKAIKQHKFRKVQRGRERIKGKKKFRVRPDRPIYPRQIKVTKKVTPALRRKMKAVGVTTAAEYKVHRQTRVAEPLRPRGKMKRPVVGAYNVRHKAAMQRNIQEKVNRLKQTGKAPRANKEIQRMIKSKIISVDNKNRVKLIATPAELSAKRFSAIGKLYSRYKRKKPRPTTRPKAVRKKALVKKKAKRVRRPVAKKKAPVKKKMKTKKKRK